MTDEHRQRLSGLLDGELDAATAAWLVDATARDEGLRSTWESYHLIGQAMRGEPLDRAHRSIASDVRRRIAQEPIPLVPRSARRARSRVLRRPAGLAIAASVALLALLATPVVMEVPDAVSPQSAPQQLVQRESIPMRQLQAERPELASKLDLYLVTHQATAPASGAKGMLPYATLVGYESSR